MAYIILISLNLIKINRLSFDQSGAYLAIASNDIKILQGISQIHSVLILLLRPFKNQNGRNFIIKASCNEKLESSKKVLLKFAYRGTGTIRIVLLNVVGS